jgi:hypothetical protein
MSEQKEKKGNWFMRHKVLTGILVFVVFIVVIGSSGGSSNTSNSTPTSQEQAKNEAKVIAKIGEVAQSSDLAFTATNVKDYQSLGNSFTRKDAQGVFKVITLKIENTGKETKTIDSSMIKLRDSQGRTFERSIDGQTAKGLAQGQVDLFLQQVQPSLSVTGEIVFDIPKDAEGLVLEVKGGLFATAAEIKLEN